MTHDEFMQAMHQRALDKLTTEQIAALHPYVREHILAMPETAEECRQLLGEDAVAGFQRGLARALGVLA